MKTNNRSRCLSLLLTVAMLLSMMPATLTFAHAASCTVNHSVPSPAPGSNFKTTKVNGRYTAVCKTCGAEFQLSVLNTGDAGIYSVNYNDASLCTAPYKDSGYACPFPGAEYKVDGSVINAYGNKWYKTSGGEWIYSGYLTYVRRIDSTLGFSGMQAPSSLKQGESYPLRGTVSSNYDITSLKGEIISTAGTVSCNPIVYPNAKSYNIYNSSLDYNMKFNKLSAGTYYVKYTAKDASGATKVWTSSNFTVKAPDENFDANGIAVSGVKGVGTITEGDHAYPAAVVRSNVPITWIWVGVISLNAGNYNTHVYEKQAWPNTSQYDISSLARQIPFENLPAGKYSFGVEGNRSGSTYFVAVSETFEVKAKAHVHHPEFVQGMEPTCTTTGCIDFWVCYECGAYFADSAGKRQITSDDTFIDVLGHNYVNGFCTRCGEADPYAVKEYTVAFNANGGSVGQSSKTVRSGEAYGDLPTPTRTGYSFEGWYTASDGGEKVTASTRVNLLGDQTLYAHWKVLAQSYTLTFDANGGSVSSSSKVVVSGESYGELPTPTRPGYIFEGWYTSRDGGDRITESQRVSLSGNVTLYAHWRKSDESYTVTFDANGGTVDPGTKTVKSGEAYGVLPTPVLKGHAFDGWYTAAGGGTKVTSATIVEATSNHTLYARWKKTSFTITFNANGGSIDTGYKIVQAGETYGELPSPKRSGYTFAGWYTAKEGGKKVAATTKVELTDDQILYAHWEQSKIDLFNPLEEGYSFSNSRYDLGLPSGYVIPLELWIEVYGEREGKSKFDQYSDVWGGSCFGFSVTSTKFYNGNLSTADYGAKDTYYIAAPRNVASAVTRLINKAQISWWLPGVPYVTFDRNSLISSCQQFADTGESPVILYIDGYAGQYDYCHAVVPWKVEYSGNDVRIYVYDNNHPGDESIYYTVHANGSYSCNYTYGGNRITIDRLGFIYLQQVLNGESSVSSRNAGSMLISVDNENVEITTLDGTPAEDLPNAYIIEKLPVGGESNGVFTEYLVPAGYYKVTTRGNEAVSVLVSSDSDVYRLMLVPENGVVSAEIGEKVDIIAASHGNVTTYLDDGSTQILPAVSGSGRQSIPSSSAELSSFNDVSSVSWFNEAVTSISTAGIVDGVGDGQYDPSGTLTVGMLVTILMRTQYGHLDSAGQWYDAYMKKAAQDGIVRDSDGLDAEAMITRAQAALLLTRYVEHFNPGWAKVRTFSSPKDMSSVPSQYRSAVANAYAWGLIHGDANGNFNPNSTLTRAEAVQMIYNYYTTIE